MSKSKQKGTSAETAVVTFLRDHGFPTAERRALSGGADKGDILAGPGLVWEVKAHTKGYDFPAWMRETETERLNALANLGILVVKPVGVGAANTGQWWTVLPLAQLTQLLRDAGYGDES